VTTGLRPPKLLNRTENGQSVKYYESDLVCTNVRPSLIKKYGWSESVGVVVWYKFDSTWKRIGDNFYFVADVKGCEMILDAGKQSVPSTWCGTDTVTVQQFSFIQPTIASVIPRFRQRGVVLGTATDTNQGILIGSGTQVNSAMSAQELISAWNTYIEAARRFGVNSEAAQAKSLFFHTRNSSGEVAREKIDTLQELQRSFPRYFQFAQEFVGQSLIELATNDKSNFIYQGVLYPTSYIGLWDRMAKSMDVEAIYNNLQQRGYTQAQIAAIRGVGGKTIHDLIREGGQATSTTSGTSGAAGSGNAAGAGSGSGGAGNGGGRSTNGQPWYGPEGYEPGKLQNITIQRSRNIFLTDDQIAGALGSQNVRFNPKQPVMYQVYPSTFNPSGGPMTAVITQYAFDFAPSEISYAGFGGEWVAIERSGGFPFIDWKSFKLLQVSFTFLIAKNTSPGSTGGRGASTGEGLDIPVTDQIEKLQRMAQTPFPVMFYGLDKLLTNQFRYDETGTARGIQFVIQDLSINAQRRNIDLDITRAQASITLQEIPIERQQIIGMPVLRHKPYVPREDRETEPDDSLGLAEESLTSQPNNSVEYFNE
jgi:hypothetical protein